MSYPKTAAAWWELLLARQAELRRLVIKFYPEGGLSSPDYPITAPAAEAVCRAAREELARERTDPGREWDYWVERRDPAQLLRLLNAAWLGMPESHAVRDEPGFFALCDLCSEADLVCPEPEEAP